jgi:hypothetical protein
VEIVNAIVVSIKVFRSVTDSDMNVKVALGVSAHDADVVGKKADDGNSGGCPMGLQFLNVVVRIRVVGENKGCDGVCCSVDSARLISGQIYRMDHV